MQCKVFLIGLLGLGLLAGCGQESASPAVSSTPTSNSSVQPARSQVTEVSGVDLSKWQGDIDFVKIKGAGKTYVFIKATQGGGDVDPDYTRNLQNARAAGLATGSYHFYMTDYKPEVQFANFSRHVSIQPGDLPPVVDIEVLSNNSQPNIAGELKLFLSLLEKAYGVKPIIYSGENFANKYLAGFANYPLWLAEYNKDKTPTLPLDWQKWTFWQHTQGGSVEGVSGAVDLDRFNGTQEQFQALLIGKQTL